MAKIKAMPDKLRGDDEKLLANQEEYTLAKWWCELNRWEWPIAIPNKEPAPRHRHGSRRSSLMQAIMDKIGLRACLREWNRDSMTDDEFNEFWKRRPR